MEPNIKRPISLQPITEGLLDLNAKTQAIDSTINHDGKTPGITVPRTMSLTRAAAALQKYAEAEESTTQIHHRVDSAHYYCAAWNLQLVLSEQYGIDFASPKPSMMGDEPPQKITFPLAHDKEATITIGQFVLPELKVETSMTTDDKDVPRLQITITCKNIDSDKATRLFQMVEKMPNPWQGKTLIFEEGREPRKVEIKHSSISRDQIALNPAEEAALTLFVDQIKHNKRLKEAGINFKRGLLLHGPWGCGKTLAAAVFMAEAEAAGITVIHERAWNRLEQTMALAKSMQPALVFCEDIDLIESRKFINSLDDASTKDSEVSLIVTTNHPEKLPQALTRTGRLDISINFGLPLPVTRQRILAINGCVDWTDQIEEATKGMTGSDLAEVSRRAKISSIANECPITADHTFSAASTMTKPPAHQPQFDIADIVMTWLKDHLGLSSMEGVLEHTHSLTDTVDDTTRQISSELGTAIDRIKSVRNYVVDNNNKLEAMED